MAMWSKWMQIAVSLQKYIRCMKTVMTIGIDVSRANREQRTGVESYVFFLVEAMKRLTHGTWNMEHGNRLRIILYSDVPLCGLLAKLPDGWESCVLRWPPRRLWTQVRLSWEMFFRPPDVLFIPGHVFPLIHPKKTVMTVHDVAALEFPKSYSRFERWYSLWSARSAVKRLWKVIVPSAYTKQALARLNHCSAEQMDHVVVVPHGYDMAYRHCSDAEAERVLNTYGIRKPFLLSVGRLEEKKNTRRIVEAFSLIRSNLLDTVPGLSLVLIGKSGFGYEQVREAIDASPYTKDIHELGWLPTDAVAVCMNAAEVFVFPSLCEGFGMPILEAFAVGTPVVASSGRGLEDAGGDAVLYVDPNDPQAIADGVRRILADSDLAKTLCTRGTKQLQSFSWRDTAEKTYDLLCS